MALGDRCLPKAREMGKEIKKWAQSKVARRYLKNPYEAAVRLVETEFLMGLDDIARRNVDISDGQLRSLKHRLSELTNAMKDGSIDNKFATTFWQTSKYGKKDPVIGALLREMQKSNFYFRRNEFEDKHHMQEILKNVEKEAVSQGIVNKYGLKFSNAQKKAKELDTKLRKAIIEWDADNSIGTKRIKEVENELSDLVSKTYLKVYDDLLYVIEKDLGRIEKEKYDAMDAKSKKAIDGGHRIKLNANDLLNAKTKDGKTMSEQPHLYNALQSYHSLMDGLYTRLRNGVNAVIDANLERVKFQNDSTTKQALNDLRKKLEDKMMPKYEGSGFFPHYTRDINVDLMNGLMPYIDELHTSNNQYLKNKSTRTVADIVNSMSSYVDSHVKGRGEDYKYSKNFLNTVTNYIHDVNRFNYISYLNKHTMKALTSVEDMYRQGKDIGGYSQSIVNYIQDLHVAANGDSRVSPRTAAVMRTLLSFEFISKLGINPRGAARNWFQKLLDYVEWGPVQVHKTNRILQRLGIDEASIESELKKVGLLFEDISPELQESNISSPASMFKTRQYNEQTGKYEIVTETMLDKVADKMGWAAGKASYLHRKAENSNRKRTFKIAYAQMYEWLDNPRFREITLKEHPDYSPEKIKQSIRSRSRNYAINMVVLNHFDYADYAKSKMLRHPIGRFLGQFQHYSFEFFERNMKIAREAKHDVMSGHIIPGQDAQGMSKAFRMSMIYFMAPAIASALMGVDFSNIIEHDTAQRLGQFATLFTGDDDEIKQAFYGKGPLVATFGGPLLSDIIDIGQQLDLINLDDDSIVKILTGLEKYDKGTSSELSQKIRILNTFAGRLTSRHIPQLVKGRIGWAAQQEFGLYPTAEARKKQRIAKKAYKKALTPELQQALEQLGQGL